MDNWYNYVDCEVKLCQAMFRNSMFLSGNPFYDFNKVSVGSNDFLELTSNLITQVVPQYVFSYVPIYGFSDKTIEDTYQNYEMVKNDIIQKFTEPDKIRKKYLFLLGGELIKYTMLDSFANAEQLRIACFESIKNYLLGARIPLEHADLLYNNSISIFVDRVISYIEESTEKERTIKDIKQYINTLYSQNAEERKKILKIIDDIEKEKIKKIEKVNLVLSLISDTVTIFSPIWPALEQLIMKLGSV